MTCAIENELSSFVWPSRSLLDISYYLLYIYYINLRWMEKCDCNPLTRYFETSDLQRKDIRLNPFRDHCRVCLSVGSLVGSKVGRR